jgi:hypothetical protein
MRVQLKWSSSRQMWVGQAVNKSAKTSSWVKNVIRWIKPVESASFKRNSPVARVWQSDRQRVL